MKKLKQSLLIPIMMLPGMAFAQSSGDIVGQIMKGICGFIKPFTGASPFLSIVFVISLGVLAFLWWLNENKEGVLVWIIRTAIVLAVLINIITLPQLIGLPSLGGACS